MNENRPASNFRRFASGVVVAGECEDVDGESDSVDERTDAAEDRTDATEDFIEAVELLRPSAAAGAADPPRGDALDGVSFESGRGPRAGAVRRGATDERESVEVALRLEMAERTDAADETTFAT